MGNYISEWQELLEEEKRLKKQKEDLREKLIGEIDASEPILPIITVEVPASYFESTGQELYEFLATRYPDWQQEARKLKDGTYTFTLKKESKFVSGMYAVEGQDVALAKTVVEYSPEIDVETLMLEDPELFDRLFQETVSWELNEEALEQEVNTNPDIYAVLRRHSKVKMPSVKILVKKVKDD